MTELENSESSAGSQDQLLYYQPAAAQAVSGDGGALRRVVVAVARILTLTVLLAVGILIPVFGAVCLVSVGVRELFVHAGVIVDDVSAPWPLVAGIVVMFAPGYRRSPANRLWSALSGVCDDAGDSAHGWIPMSWDRPTDDVVALMNTWLSQSRAGPNASAGARILS